MRKLFLISGILLLCGGIAWGVHAFLFQETEETRVLRLFSGFAEKVSKNGKEGAIPAATKAKELSEMFHDPVLIQVPGASMLNGNWSRGKMQSNIFQARAMFLNVTLSFDDPVVIFEEDHCKVEFSAVVKGKLRNGETIREVRELESLLKKEDSRWCFQEIRLRKIIEK